MNDAGGHLAECARVLDLIDAPLLRRQQRWHGNQVDCSKTARRTGAGNSGSQDCPERLEADVVAMPFKVAVVADGER
ncbi:hypothetical protein [Bradyrhizobium sp. WSM2793]|uniref:hypothetical protein n=1 Tax=Bradyrhizobium sp. WSM2793 TaxID=1038866 RepID=UPI0012FA448B|nr:hypothetical protein [Bradyrhizobium sp. WSM2793]